MADRGFEQTITASDGTIYHLPTAEYRLHQNLLSATATINAAERTLRYVHNQVRAAIDATILESAINRVSHLKGSHTTSQVMRTRMSNLEEL